MAQPSASDPDFYKRFSLPFATFAIPLAVLPIVRRELQMAARKPAVYRLRLLIGGVAALVAVCCLAFSRVAPDQAGSVMFGILTWGVFIITVLDCVRCAGDALSWERREGTLGLLFLANLRGYDVVLGKFSSAAAKAFTTLVVTFPILALPLMMGGITAGEWARTMLTLATTGLFCLSAALMLSSVSTGALTAMVGSLALITAIMLIPVGIANLPFIQSPDGFLWLSGPLGMLLSVQDGTVTASAWTFWNPFFFSVASSGAMLVATCLLVIRPGSFEPIQKRDAWWKRWIEPKRGPMAPGSVLDAPGSWLAERTLPGRRTLRILIAIGAVICLLIVAFSKTGVGIGTILTFQICFCLGVKLWLAAIAPQSMHASKSCGALELLLCTPLRPAALVRGQMTALVSYVRLPALAVCVGFPLVGVVGGVFVGKPVDEMGGLLLTILFGAFWFVVFLLDLYAIAYTGLWNGLTCVKIEQAVARTVGYVLLLPWLTTILPLIGFVGWVLWPVFWICWSSYKLNHRFTDRVASQFAHTGER